MKHVSLDPVLKMYVLFIMKNRIQFVITQQFKILEFLVIKYVCVEINALFSGVKLPPLHYIYLPCSIIIIIDLTE